MRIRPKNKTPVLVLALATAMAAAPAPAAAEHRPRPFDVSAAITACRGDALTVAAEISPASGSRNRRAASRAVRRVRGATLRLRFEAAPLYGPARRSREIRLGRTTSARRFERFSDLAANTYAGVVRYRWVRGSRTVMSGVVRTRKARVAGRRGRAFCALRVGKPPVDTRPPVVIPVPGDSAWKRGPLDVYLFAIDDLSGVALVVSRVDGGPFTRGRRVRIATEGVHQLTYVARDAAGNQSAPATVTLRVDMGAPTEPTIASPSGPANDTTPEIRWNAALDSGSGVQSYIAVVRDASGAIVWSETVGATARAVTVGQTLAAGQYTAEVFAVDGASPRPFTSRATSSFSIVAAGSSTADSDADTVADSSDNCPFAANTSQTDTDADGSGDACDADDDNDGDADGSDNCPTTANPNQENTGGGAAGDACEDRDGDGVLDATDNCKGTSNADQANVDGDALGDHCDDSDGDGLTDHAERTRNPPTRWDLADTDGDGSDDAADPCPTDAESDLDPTPDGCPSVTP